MKFKIQDPGFGFWLISKGFCKVMNSIAMVLSGKEWKQFVMLHYKKKKKNSSK